MTIQGQSGRDAAQAIEAGVQQLGKEVTREAITTWNTESQKRVMEAAEGRSTLDVQRDQRGSLEGREQNDLHELAQEFTVPYWDDTKNAWVFAVTHAAAVFHEWGAQPHEIRAKQARALVFEWPDMPPEVRDKFESQWASLTNSLEEPEVAYDNVDHPGVPAIGFMRYGRDKAASYLQSEGFSTQAFAAGLDSSGGADDGAD